MKPQFIDEGAQLRALFVGGEVVIQCASAVTAHLFRFDLYRASFAETVAAARLRHDGSLANLVEFLHAHLDEPTMRRARVVWLTTDHQPTTSLPSPNY